MIVTIGGRRGRVEGLGLVELGYHPLARDLIDLEYQYVRWVDIEGGFVIDDGVTAKFHCNQTCVLGGQNLCG